MDLKCLDSSQKRSGKLCLCDKKFCTDDDLKNHIKNTHQSQDKVSEVLETTENTPHMNKEKLANNLVEPVLDDLHKKTIKETPPIESTSAYSNGTQLDPVDTSFQSSKSKLIHLCMLCGKGFPDEPELSAHEKDDHEVKCDICSSTFYTSYDLEIHIRSVHKVPPKTTPTTSIQTESTDAMPCSVDTREYFPCKKCGIIFGFKEALQDHILSLHKVKSTPEFGLQFSSHVQPSTLKKCEQCDFTAGTDLAFELHIQSDHIPPPVNHPFPCSTCGKVFGEISDLNNHVKRCHTHRTNPDTKYNDLKHYLKYIIEQNQEMMEDFCLFKQSVEKKHQRKIVVVQEELKSDLKVAVKSSKLTVEAAIKSKNDHQNLVVGGMDALAKQMIELENQHHHIVNQVNTVSASVPTVSEVLTATGISNNNPPSQPTSTNASGKTQTVNIQKKRNTQRTCTKCSFHIYSDLHLKKHMKLKH